MGAKSAVKLRNRGIAYKCNLCGRKLMSPDALVAHQRTAHNIISKRRERSKQAPKLVKPAKAEIKQEIVPKPTPPSSVKSKEMKKNMVEFECPKCFKRFPTYFPAHKHIQKYHCVNRQNQNVSPNHPSLIQPVRIELCLKCDMKVKSIQTHVCELTKKDTDDKKLFVCTACDEWFPNIKAFDLHVLSIHGDGVESMFFPTSIEFTQWKTEMEQQTNASYAVLDKYDSKRYYHCNFVKDNRNKDFTTYFCPSTIVIQEFCKGIQVHFYKNHFKHCFVDYKLSNKYKKYSITSFLKRSEDYNNLSIIKSDDNDLYMQFKTLMEGIVVDAAKINIATLKIILGKALEITSILTNYDEEIEDNNMTSMRSNQAMTDSEIAEALEEPLAKRRLLDKLDTEDTKRPRVEFDDLQNEEISSPKIINSFSLADTENVKKINEIMKEENKDVQIINQDENKKHKERRIKKSVKNDVDDDAPSSFNDSYKDFVVKNFPNMETIATRSRSKPVVKTRIGQFKPNLTQISPTQTSPKPHMTIDGRPKKIDASKLMPIETKTQDKPKDIDNDTPKIKPNKTQRNLESPKPQTINKTNPRVSFDKPKVDYEYEVKEQDEGCNILILKIL